MTDLTDYTMITYIVLGLIILLVDVPLIFNLLSQKRFRYRKDFLLFACASSIDMFYVVVTIWNSACRLHMGEGKTTRADCIRRPMMFLSIVANLMIAYMPTMIAFDRLVAAKKGVWYHRQTIKYSVYLCSVFLCFCAIVAFLNYNIIVNGKYGLEMVSSMCFTTTLIAPIFYTFYNLVKWFGIFMGVLLFLLAVITLHVENRFNMSTSDFQRSYRGMHKYFALTSLNSILFHFAPDFMLVFVENKSLLLISALYSLIMFKSIANFLCMFLVYHEIRQIFVYIFSCCPKESSTIQVVQFNKNTGKIKLQGFRGMSL
ncbi:G_PROTEIN_RECEP_F1_2 domain-containing protein [Caenorhabditis elegans]|uniref:G_PROTEIN_RECEP_F1_2 domain-containing protein n=1 Tax=Caenorhabditis elegans TaxID=6239 RepID=Q2MGE8_CAEEL|nr:G_PROTEIN_RECEP_F1_2 domain-containing protein [Caenorhabditis elegans]CCD66733.1 G_PROTEIN_RECEP_F1_2 domain-containing protein [Caenorhabditis elegans]|eukprot:NP_500091.4 Uncharacterized protein CELE_K03H6.4 [Caenorhabditis elegans]